LDSWHRRTLSATFAMLTASSSFWHLFQEIRDDDVVACGVMRALLAQEQTHASYGREAERKLRNLTT